MADWITGTAAGAAPGTAGALADNNVKLVGYFLVSVKRGRERVIPDSGDTIIVTSNMSDDAFVSFAVGRYLQKSAEPKHDPTREALECVVRVLRSVSMAPDDRSRLTACERMLEHERWREQRAAGAKRKDQLAPGEERFLRVHFAVIRRWPREPIKHEERQQAVLEQIRDQL